MADKQRVKRATVHLPDRDLMTTRVRGIGFRGSCSCGEAFPKRRTYREARADQREHAHAAHGEHEPGHVKVGE